MSEIRQIISYNTSFLFSWRPPRDGTLLSIRPFFGVGLIMLSRLRIGSTDLLLSSRSSLDDDGKHLTGSDWVDLVIEYS